MMLRPIRWLLHISATKKNDPVDAKFMRSIEMEVRAANKDEAMEQGKQKASDLGYNVWGTRAAPLLNDKEPVIDHARILETDKKDNNTPPLLPAPEQKQEIVDVFLDSSFFSAPIDLPKYGRSIEHDSCP